MIDAEGRRAAELVGRAEDAERIARALAAARAESVPAVIEIEGDAGIGKSALLEAVVRSANDEGWVVPAATCRPIQTEIPLAAVQQILRSLLSALGDERERYASGLETLLGTAETLERSSDALQRLLEGVTLDHPVLVALDDAHWADPDSLAALGALVNANAQRPLGILLSKRPLRIAGAIAPSLTIALQPLTDADALAVARRILPEAAESVLDAIVRHARGYPLDVIAISDGIAAGTGVSVEDVASSRRAAIARDVRQAPSDVREFLQICSLVDGSIEYRILEKLFPGHDKLDDLIGRAAGRYLVSEGSRIGFVHALIAEGVRETIAIPAPYRRRIIDALRQLDDPSPEESETLASQLAANGDKAGAFETLADLAEIAARRGQIRLTASASARALAFSMPQADRSTTFFTDYADALFALDRDVDAISILGTALRQLRECGSPLPGAAIARLILAQCFSDRLSAAEATYARFSDISDPVERAHVLSAGLWFAVCTLDRERADGVRNQLDELGPRLPQVVALRACNFTALISELSGEHDRATTLLREAESIANATTLLGPRGIMQHQLAIPQLFVTMWEFGTRAIDSFLQRRAADGISGTSDSSSVAYFRALNGFLTERWDSAEAAVAETVDGDSAPTGKRRVLAISAAMACLGNRESQHQRAIEAEVSRFLGGRHEGWFLPLAVWWAAQVGTSDKKVASSILTQALARLKNPIDPHVYLPRFALVAAAQRLGDQAALRELTEAAQTGPHSPWHRAHGAIARCLAEKFAGLQPKGAADAIDECRRLGLTLYADIASVLVGKSDATASARLSTLGIKWTLPKGASRSQPQLLNRPTARELQVAELVSLGKSNQEIAETLVLSQRTVEAHLSNLFNKLDVSSRTQLAAWFLRRESSI